VWGELVGPTCQSIGSPASWNGARDRWMALSSPRSGSRAARTPFSPSKSIPVWNHRSAPVSATTAPGAAWYGRTAAHTAASTSQVSSTGGFYQAVPAPGQVIPSGTGNRSDAPANSVPGGLSRRPGGRTLPSQPGANRFTAVASRSASTFGPDGLTSHHDHVRAGEAAAEAFRRARAAEGEPADAFLRLYQAAYPRSEVDRFYAGVRQGRFDYGEEGRLFDLTGVPDERIAVRVDTRAVSDRKWAAILRHQTQLGEHERIPEPLRWIVLDAECFVQAFPPRAPGEPVQDDLLTGLELRR
jgi:hypothetical protein